MNELKIKELQGEKNDIELQLAKFEMRIIEEQGKIRDLSLPIEESKRKWFEKRKELNLWRINALTKRKYIEKEISALKPILRAESEILEEILIEIKKISEGIT